MEYFAVQDRNNCCFLQIKKGARVNKNKFLQNSAPILNQNIIKKLILSIIN